MAGATLIDVRFVDNATPTLKKVDDKVRRLKDSVGQTQQNLGKTNKGLKGMAASFFGVGKGAKAATVGVAGFGATMKAQLMTLAAPLAAMASLTAAFQTLSKQDFSERKFETLGGNADLLVTRLSKLSAELQGSRSITELTAASYDVASAGFIKAADTTEVLKAASLGATGGFADLNTAGNALTSVLNAYGLSASESGQIMDKFIQTQNDGKIVVAEYAANIGKVASVAAMLKIPLSEVNAVIAQSTAGGVKAEVAFTGLKTAILKMASPEGLKKMEKYGLNIDATTIKSEGLLKTLQKMQGVDETALTDIFGTEAIQVISPLINDMEKFNALVEKQRESQGVAAKAAFKASDTLNGQVQRLATSFTNLFADNSELGELLKLTITGLAGTIEAFAAGLKAVGMALRGAWSVAESFAKGIGLIKENAEGAAGPIQRLTQWWFKNIGSMVDAQKNLIKSGQETGQRLANVYNLLREKVVRNFDKIKTRWDNFTTSFSEAVAPLKKVGDAIAKAVGGALLATLKAIKALWDKIIGQILRGLNALMNLPGIKHLIGFTQDQLSQISASFNAPIAATANGENTEGSPSDKPNKKKKETIDLNNRIIEQTKRIKALWQDVGITIGQGVHGAIKGIIQGTQTMAQALNNVLNSIANKLLDAGISSLLSGLFPGTTKIGKFLGFANGGRPPVGQPSIVGERGPELFVPGSAGSIIPNNQLGGSNTTINISVDASGTSVEGDEGQGMELGRMISAAIQSELIREKRPGGLLA